MAAAQLLQAVKAAAEANSESMVRMAQAQAQAQAQASCPCTPSHSTPRKHLHRKNPADYACCQGMPSTCLLT